MSKQPAYCIHHRDRGLRAVSVSEIDGDHWRVEDNALASGGAGLPPQLIQVGNFLYRRATMSSEELGELASKWHLHMEEVGESSGLVGGKEVMAPAESVFGFLDRLSYLGMVGSMLLGSDFGPYSLQSMAKNGPNENTDITPEIKNLIGALRSLVSFTTTGSAPSVEDRDDGLVGNVVPPNTPKKMPTNLTDAVALLPRALRVYDKLIAAWDDLKIEAPNWWYGKGDAADRYGSEFQELMSKFNAFLTGHGPWGTGIMGARGYRDKLEKYIEHLKAPPQKELKQLARDPESIESLAPKTRDKILQEQERIKRRYPQEVVDPEGYASGTPLPQETKQKLLALSPHAQKELLKYSEDQVAEVVELLPTGVIEEMMKLQPDKRKSFMQSFMEQGSRAVASVLKRCAQTDGSLKLPAWNVKYQEHTYQYFGLA